jgi:prepilin-type processing-associated H-X9-DG protein
MSGVGTGRIYTITIKAMDAAGAGTDDLDFAGTITDAGTLIDERYSLNFDGTQQQSGGSGEDLLIGGRTAFDTSQAVGEVGAYWEMHDLLLANQSTLDPGRPQTSPVLTFQGDRLDPDGGSVGWFRYSTTNPSSDEEALDDGLMTASVDASVDAGGHTGGINVVFGDGSVHSINSSDSDASGDTSVRQLDGFVVTFDRPVDPATPVDDPAGIDDLIIDAVISEAATAQTGFDAQGRLLVGTDGGIWRGFDADGKDGNATYQPDTDNDQLLYTWSVTGGRMGSAGDADAGDLTVGGGTVDGKGAAIGLIVGGAGGAGSLATGDADAVIDEAFTFDGAQTHDHADINIGVGELQEFTISKANDADPYAIGGGVEIHFVEVSGGSAAPDFFLI